LLCAIDFSESSIAALRFALSLAQESDAALTMLHVLEWPWAEPPAPRLEDLPIEQGAALWRRGTATVRTPISAPLARTSGVTASTGSPLPSNLIVVPSARLL
jgi:nucleotide-binding universal stress UspA family protein